MLVRKTHILGGALDDKIRLFKRNWKKVFTKCFIPRTLTIRKGKSLGVILRSDVVAYRVIIIKLSHLNPCKSVPNHLKICLHTSEPVDFFCEEKITVQKLAGSGRKR